MSEEFDVDEFLDSKSGQRVLVALENVIYEAAKRVFWYSLGVHVLIGLAIGVYIFVTA